MTTGESNGAKEGGGMTCALMPREPTKAMLEAVREKPHPTRPDGWSDRHAAMWRRMWDAHFGSAQGGFHG